MKVPVFTASKIRDLPLKEMDPLLLTHALAIQVQETNINSDLVDTAVEFAAYLHRNDKRENRAGFPKTAYIEHPLRNAIRVLRAGTTSAPIVVGCLLHDTVEDHPFEIAKQFADVYGDEFKSREASFKFIGKEFGDDVERIVRGMSNPILEKNVTAEQKRFFYLYHVVEATLDPDVLVCKISDYIDNALSLHHTMDNMSSDKLKRLALKYLPLHDLFLDRLKNLEIPLSDAGILSWKKQLAAGQIRLKAYSEAP